MLPAENIPELYAVFLCSIKRDDCDLDVSAGVGARLPIDGDRTDTFAESG
jgi:hypothetical protein